MAEEVAASTKCHAGKKACAEEWRKGPWKFTQEEMAVFKECKKNSFWYRALPLSLAVMSATHYAVSKGYLRANKYVGSLVKVVGFGFLAFGLGRASYIPTCRKKILALENSSVAEAFRNSPYGPMRTMWAYRKHDSCCKASPQQQATPPSADSASESVK